jgi:hypothetical protein
LILPKTEIILFSSSTVACLELDLGLLDIGRRNISELSISSFEK